MKPAVKRKTCVNAGQDANHRKRVAKYPGPRCFSCHTPVVTVSSDRRHDAYVVVTYELEPGEYKRLLGLQGGKCAICPAPLKYTKRRYAVDHDHKAERVLGTRLSVRGLLCKRHNNLLRDVRDSVEVLQAAIDYLNDPPAWKIISGNRQKYSGEKTIEEK